MSFASVFHAASLILMVVSVSYSIKLPNFVTSYRTVLFFFQIPICVTVKTRHPQWQVSNVLCAMHRTFFYHEPLSHWTIATLSLALYCFLLFPAFRYVHDIKWTHQKTQNKHKSKLISWPLGGRSTDSKIVNIERQLTLKRPGFGLSVTYFGS